MNRWPLIKTAIASEADVVAVRQRAKAVAEAIGFDRQDQTRIATAVSEIARNALAYGGGGHAEFVVATDGREQRLTVTIEDRGRGIDDLDAVLGGRFRSATGMGIGLSGARRLMDGFEIASGRDGTRVAMMKTLPRSAAALDGAAIRRLADRLRGDEAPDAFTALRDQNRDLIQSFSDLNSRQDELGRLNRELEETNRGIVALYSELDQKAEQLRQASELKSRFLSYVSHEFRTPLNSILGLSRILLDRLDGELSAEQEKQVVYIRQSAESLTELVNDLLDLAKVESGRIDLHHQPVEVEDLFAGLRGALRPLLGTKPVEFTVGVRGTIPTISTDEGKVSQILRNLVSNAIKFTEQGSVTVTAEHRRDGDRVVFTVADTGIGIAPEHRAKIFEEFGQVDGPLQRKQKGTGLGLPLARKLAELLGGTIEVESAPGRGSVFRLDLPANAARAPSDGRAMPRRILVIDDEAPFRYLVRQMLRDVAGIDEVAEAGDGDDGLAKIAALAPDAVLLDLQMPGRDGFAVHRSLQADGSLRRLPVVIATSNPITPDLKAALPDVAGFLAKNDIARDRLIALLAGLAAAEGRTP